MKFFKDIFTEDDGVSYCFAKVFGAVILIAYLCNATLALWLVKEAGASGISTAATVFAAMGAGLAEVLGGVAVLIAGKQITQKTIPPSA
jgi:predicted phage tail protein